MQASMQKHPGTRTVPGLSWWQVAVLVTALAGPAATGQPADAADEADNEPAAQQAEPSSEASGEDVFIPTEEISEDFAVSFPVDI